MLIWIVLALMTGAAVLAVMLPLSRRGAADGANPDVAFYHEQLTEIERDVARGLLGPAEAEAARVEAGRRLIRAGERSRGASAVGEPALRRRRAMSAIILSAVPLLAITAYGIAGSPGLPAQPLVARLRATPAAADSNGLDLAAGLARIEAHLAQNPEDGRGHDVIAPVYLRIGRADDSVKAYRQALRLLGEAPARLGGYGEALIASAGGVVSAEARAAFERVLALDPADPRGRYYLALAAEQDGDVEGARRRYGELIASAPADAPWLQAVRERLARLGGDSGPAALPEGDRAAAIRQMVEGLASRLEAGGGSPEEWARLVRSYVVLGERDRAAATLARARQSLPGSGEALDRLAGELGLSGAQPGGRP